MYHVPTRQGAALLPHQSRHAMPPSDTHVFTARCYAHKCRTSRCRVCVCVSVCLFICLSHSCIASKRIKILQFFSRSGNPSSISEGHSLIRHLGRRLVAGRSVPTDILFITLRASCGAVYCNRSCLFVGVWVGVFVCGSVTTITRNCVHRSSPNSVCG